MSNTNSQGRWEFDENGNVRYVPPKDAGPQVQPDGSYRYSRPQQKKVSKKSDDGWHWVLIILGFVVWWPVGLVLLFLQLGGKWPGSKKVDQEFRRATAAAQNAARQFSQAQKAQRAAQQGSNPGEAHAASHEARRTAQWQQTMDATRAAQQRQQARQDTKRKKKESGGNYGLGHVGLFRTIGGIMAGLFGFAFVMELIDDLTYFVGWDYLLGETTPLLALMLIGVTLIGVAGSRKRKLKHFQKYMTMIGDRTVVPIASLAKAMGVSEKRAEKDLEEMLERDFWDSGYVDAARRALVLGGPVEDEPESQPEPEPQEADDTAAATLKHIRDVNDAIANEELSGKINRIEELTAKIFKLLEERPEKAGELRGFMNYYLPQTLKILESYSKLEAQGIEGENIAEAKGKIEAMMDKLVDGYETQLDKLFADDVLDISADLKVMESMLEKDGLTVESELRF